MSVAMSCRVINLNCSSKSWYESLFMPNFSRKIQLVIPMSRYVYLDTFPNYIGIFRVIVPMSRYVYLDTLPNHTGIFSSYSPHDSVRASWHIAESHRFSLCLTCKDDVIYINI